MNIEDGKVVTMDYVLKNCDGDVLDTSQKGEFAYLHGAKNIIPGLEKELLGKAAGDQLSVVVAPEEAYGKREENLVQVVPRDMFPEDADIRSGMQFNAQSPEGDSLIITVANIEGDSITVDGNHALAGEELHFEVNVINVRDASDEEKQHGHVHGLLGHDH